MTRELWPAFRRWLGFEAFIAAAMAATALALYFQDALTLRTLSFGPDEAGLSFYPYSFDDSLAGGASNSRLTGPLSWRCKLQRGVEWPYCGVGLLFDRTQQGKGLDLRDYGNLKVKFDYSGPAQFIRLILKNQNVHYRAADGSMVQKKEQVDLPVGPGSLQLQRQLGELTVADWWTSARGSAAERARLEFQNVSAAEFVVGPDGAMGDHKLRVREVSFERRLISTQAY
jgi:hypothetical protein